MIVKWISLFQKQQFYFICLGIALICFVAGSFGLIIFQNNQGNAEKISAITNGSATGFLTTGLIFGLAALIFLAMIIYRSHLAIPNSLSEAYQYLADKQSKNLSLAMTELALGNLSVKTDIKTWAKSPPVRNFLSRSARDLQHQIQSASEELNNLTFTSSNRLFYVGADSYLEGRKCGETMGKLLNGRGEIIISTKSLTNTGQELRRKGFQSVLRKKYPKIHILDIVENREDLKYTYQITSELLIKYPNLKGIYVTEGATPPATARAVQNAGMHGKIKLIAHDLMDETMQFIQKGVLSATLGQDPFVQGHDPVIHLFNHLVAGWMPPVPRLLTDMDVITPDNYTTFWQSGIGVVQSGKKSGLLAKPVKQVSEKPIKLAILFRSENAFWHPIRDGYREAAKKIEPLNATVEWIEPDYDGINIDISKYSGLLNSLVEQKFTGIATVAPNRLMIPLLNDVIKKGIAVATFNSEPLNMRSLISTITDQTKQLLNASQNLTDHADQANQATTLIKSTMNTIADGAVSQNNHITQTRDILESLLADIVEVNQVTDESTRATEANTKAVGEGVEAMDKTLTTMKDIENSVTAAGEIVKELAMHSNRVDDIVNIIRDISSRVNVLALNASIEATQAEAEGEGFMVIAQKIRQLALNTQNASSDIEQLVNVIKSDIENVDNVMTEGLKAVQLSAESTTNAQKDLGEILTQVDLDQNRLKNIANMLTEMQTFSHRVQEAMDKVAEISESNKNAVDNIHESTREMTRKFQKVTELANLLEVIAQSELELLAKFNLS